MPKLFGIDVAKEIASAMGSGLLPLTLHKVVASSSTSASLSSGETTEVPHSGRGILEEYHEKQFDGTIIQVGDRKVLMLGGTLPSGVFPEPSDLVTIEGTKFSIISVMRDPAAASYICQVRV